MKSIRTPLAKSDAPMFRSFLDSIGLEEVKIGDYEDIDSSWYIRHCICYAYSEKSDEVVAILTHISLKYGSLYKAFSKYMIDIQSSLVNDPYFNWTP